MDISLLAIIVTESCPLELRAIIHIVIPQCTYNAFNIIFDYIGEVESKHYLVLAIKTLFIHSPDSFDTSKLSLLPDPLSNPNFTDDFMTYILQDEWNHFMAYSVCFIL